MQRIDDKIETTLFIEKSNYDIEKWNGRKITIDEAKEISGVENVKYVENYEAWLTSNILNNKIGNLFMDLEKLSFNEEDTYAHKMAKNIRERFFFINISTIHPMMNELRIIKDEFEIEMMRKAIELTKIGLEDTMKFLKPGVLENQLEATFAYSIRMNGADGNSFPTIAANGKDAWILHYVENNKEVEDNSLVLLDLGAQYKEYCADITRTYPTNGVFTKRQKQIYNIVLRAVEEVSAIIKPGLKFDALNDKCKEVLTEELVKIGMIKDDTELSKYYYHGVSHPLGLDVHDLGYRDIELKEGMVFTVEPGLYIKEEGIGIRIEDDVLVTKDGYEVLSKDIIKTVEEIEHFMKK
jgi:Xaa-Pro aminopeptidase